MREANDNAKKPPLKELDMMVSAHEKNLIELIRNIEYGELDIVIKGGEPIQADRMKKSIKL